jgi:outer membrane protein assembly factor BamE (lipoprotein component of BamABCDE complex)
LFRSALLLVCLVLPLLAGCGFFEAPSQVRGNLVDEDRLHELVVNTATRADASSLLGSPTARASFNDNDWIYIGQVTRPLIASTQAVLSQEVIVLSFDDAGVLRGIKRMDKANSLPVDVVARATPTPGGTASFMQQLMGNVGRFNPAGAGGQAGGGIPGGGIPGSGQSIIGAPN